MKKAIFTLVLFILSMLFITNALAHTVEITNVLEYLTSTKNMDGSWNDDPYSALPVLFEVSV